MPWTIEGEGDNQRIAVKDGKATATIKKPDGTVETVYVDADQIFAKVAELTKEAQANREKAEALEVKLAPFATLQVDGKPVTPEDVQKAIELSQNVKGGQLIAAEKAQQLRDEIDRGYKKTIEEKEAEIQRLKADNEAQLIGWDFATSKFVEERLCLTPDQARSFWGSRFKRENGATVAYDEKGEKVMSKENYTMPAGVDEALAFFVEKDPHRDRYLKGDGAGGSGVTPGSPSRKSGPVIAETDALGHLEAGLRTM